MVNNSNNISKTNNHLSSKESLNSDGQQFQQYKRNEQSPLISNSLTTKETRTYDVGNPGPALGQAHHCGKVKPLNGIPTLPSW